MSGTVRVTSFYKVKGEGWQYHGLFSLRQRHDLVPVFSFFFPQWIHVIGKEKKKKTENKKANVK